MSAVRRIGLLLSLVGLLMGLAAAPASAIPRINHVFIIVMENKDYEDTFGPNSPAPYLAKTLPSKGVLLARYYATTHLSHPNYIAMISGQPPNIQTQSDCQIFTDFVPSSPPPDPDGIVAGQGCVYPFGRVQTIANQLEGHGYRWKGYMEGMANEAADNGGSPNCVHPAIGAHDETQEAEPGHQYATRHNPFVYFHSLLDRPPVNTPSSCERNVVPYTRLARDLQRTSTTPNYSFIVPNLCNDGHDEPCVTGEPGGLHQINTWLKANVPPILNSPGYKDGGLLLITFDEAEVHVGPPPSGDGTACCNEQPGPNTPNPAGPIPGRGGGKIGLVALSPCIKPGQVFTEGFNHYSLLRSIEDIFDLGHLGYAGQDGLTTFNAKLFRRSPCPNVAGP